MDFAELTSAAGELFRLPWSILQNPFFLDNHFVKALRTLARTLSISLSFKVKSTKGRNFPD
jgi:hypothetical protein